MTFWTSPEQAPEPEPSMPMPSMPVPSATHGARRRWPLVIGAALLAFILGGGSVYLATNPAKTHLRDQRNTVQAELDQANTDLATAKTAASSASLTNGACQRLVTDATTLLGDWDKLAAIWQDPANQNVVAGSARDQALSVQIGTIVESITFDRGLVSSDKDACRTAGKGV